MSPIDEIKARLDIVDIVSETVTLKKTGRNYIGFCPFHSNTKTPAFVVFPETQTWRCFGACADGGDMFSFVMKREGYDFKEALRVLAEQAGFPQLHEWDYTPTGRAGSRDRALSGAARPGERRPASGPVPLAHVSPQTRMRMSTPAGMFSLASASIVFAVGSVMKIRRLCVRISNCSRDFLSMCGERNTV